MGHFHTRLVFATSWNPIQVECLPKYCAKTCKDQQGYTHQVWKIFMHTIMVLGRRATGGKLIATNATASTEARLSARGKIARRRAKTNMDTHTKLETGCLSKEQPFLDC